MINSYNKWNEGGNNNRTTSFWNIVLYWIIIVPLIVSLFGNIFNSESDAVHIVTLVIIIISAIGSFISSQLEAIISIMFIASFFTSFLLKVSLEIRSSFNRN